MARRRRLRRERHDGSMSAFRLRSFHHGGHRGHRGHRVGYVRATTRTKSGETAWCPSLFCSRCVFSFGLRLGVRFFPSYIGPFFFASFVSLALPQLQNVRSDHSHNGRQPRANRGSSPDAPWSDVRLSLTRMGRLRGPRVSRDCAALHPGPTLSTVCQ